jgi:hypothetical protein
LSGKPVETLGGTSLSKSAAFGVRPTWRNLLAIDRAAV